MKLLLALIAICFSLSLSAQESQKPFIGRTWLKPPAQNKNAKSFTFPGSMTNPDTTFLQFKAFAGVAYSYPDYKAMGLTGVSYQHIQYKYQTADAPDQIYCDWAINLVYGGGGTTTPDIKNVDFSSFGVGAAFFNRKVSLYILASRYSNIPTDQTPQPKKTFKPVFAVALSL